MTAALLSALLCLSLFSVPAFAATLELDASYTSGATTVSVSASGLSAGEDFPLIAIRKGSELIAMDIAGAADADGSLTVASISTGALSKGEYTVTLSHADGTVAATGTLIVKDSPTPHPQKLHHHPQGRLSD